MSQSGNLYDILGVKRYASIDEVKTTFKQLALKYHPDRNPNNPQVEEVFKRMVAAYNVLSDEEEKRKYDLRLSGFYSFKKKEETEEEKKAKRRAEVKRMRQKLKEREEKEIVESYLRTKKRIPYKWRYLITITLTAVSFLVILHNWFLLTIEGEVEGAFFRMFLGYVLSVAALIFFLNALFRKWNAKNVKNPLSFDVRNRIGGLYVIYILFMITFTFNAPSIYKSFHLAAFSKTTTAYVHSTGNGLVIIYKVAGKRIVKHKEIKGAAFFWGEIPLKIRYSSISPHISEIIAPANEILEL